MCVHCAYSAFRSLHIHSQWNGKVWYWDESICVYLRLFRENLDILSSCVPNDYINENEIIDNFKLHTAYGLYTYVSFREILNICFFFLRLVNEIFPAQLWESQTLVKKNSLRQNMFYCRVYRKLNLIFPDREPKKKFPKYFTWPKRAQRARFVCVVLCEKLFHTIRIELDKE